MSLSVCLLTRDEEKNLARALQSVAGLADEVVVADTGSTDQTVRIATRLGARVVPYAWDDDFAAARDFALAQARSDWILWLNPDEEVSRETFVHLREGMTRQDVAGFYVLVQDQLRPDEPDACSESAQLRVLRRGLPLRSAGRLHPVFVPTVEEAAAAQGKQVPYVATVLRRHAYLSQLNEAKLRWSLRLLELELRDRPGRLPYLIEYGKTLLLANDSRGHEVLAEAVEQVLVARRAAAPPSPAVQRLFEYLLTVDPAQSRSRLSREETRALALRWFPTSPPLLWQIALQHFQANEFQHAARLLEKLVDLGKTGAYDHSEGFEPGIIGEPALMNLAVCHLRLGDLDRAEACFLQLMAGSKFRDKAAQNLVVVQMLRAQNMKRLTEE
jgi:hypothetical protein